MIRTGIFSGSFNPIHIGHLALANWICEFELLDEVWFLVTPHNPLKKQEDLIDDHLRLEMVQAAVGDYAKFKASDFEFHLPKPSYSIDTLEALEKMYPDRAFTFIMGADNWERISCWKDYKKILDRYPILVYPRKDYEIHIPDIYPDIKAISAPEIEISSTFIRESYRLGKDVRFFLPESVRPYFLRENV